MKKKFLSVLLAGAMMLGIIPARAAEQVSNLQLAADADNAAMVEMDASVIDPSYAEAVKVMYYMGVLPNIYRDYNKAVTGETLFPAIVKLMGLTETAETLKNKNSMGGYELGSDMNGYLNALDGAGYSLMVPQEEMSLQIIENYILLSIYDSKRTLDRTVAGSISSDTALLLQKAEKIMNEYGWKENLTLSYPMTCQELAQLLYNILDVPTYSMNLVFTDQGKWSWSEIYDSGKTVLEVMGYTEGDLDEFAASPDLPVYAEEEASGTPAPQTQIKLTIDNPVASLNGQEITNDVAPIIRNSSTMLPIRFVVEALGGTVTWDGTIGAVGIVSDDVTISLVVGAEYATVNGEEVKLNAPSFIQNGRTYLPLRFVSERLGATVDWDAATRSVTITK